MVADIGGNWGVDGTPVMGTRLICCDRRVLIRFLLVKVSLFPSVLSETRSTCTNQRNILNQMMMTSLPKLYTEIQMVSSMKKQKLQGFCGHTTRFSVTPRCGPQKTLRNNMVFVLHVDAGTQDVGRRHIDRRTGHHMDSIGTGGQRCCVMTNGYLCLQEVHYVTQILS